MQREIKITSQVGDQLKFLRLTATEELGRLFLFQVDAVSKVADIKLRDLLGTPMTVKVDCKDGVIRYFNGIVSEAGQTGFENFEKNRYVSYRFTLVPKPWLLTQKRDCRIYKNLSVPDIIKLVLSEVGYTDVRLSLRTTYPKREYCVQYRETYHNFIHRLMEQEGIYYYFAHDAGAHTMVLSDDLDAHKKIKPKSELMYRPNAKGKEVNDPSIFEFDSQTSVQTGKVQLTDYDPLNPKASLLSTDSAVNPEDQYQGKNLDEFDYPGDFDVKSDGARYAQVRVEAVNARHSIYTGSTNAFALNAGGLFNLKAFPRKDLEQEYLVTSTAITLVDSEYIAGEGDESSLEIEFHAISSKQPYRSIPSTPRPSIAGLQTAVVCGSEDAEDIVVDKYGRVQVMFYWNKTDKPKYDVSCPVRVATPWAGKQWGAIHIPRVGQEVVVSFLEGNPDRPLIVGSVYNADNMPPYDLPANMTQSGIKSRSHKGGAAANFNEIRFEDKKDSEELFIHAEKDMREEVEHDHFVDIDNDETENIKGTRTHDVTGDDKLTAHANKTADVTQKYQLTAGTEIELVTGASSIVMKSSGDIEIKGVNIKITGSVGVTMQGQVSVDIKAGATLNIKSDAMLEASGGAMATIKAPMLTLKGDAMAQLSGGIVMIG